MTSDTDLLTSGTRELTLLSDFSLEMTAKDIDQLEAAAHLLPTGTSVSITFLPNEDYEGRIAAAVAVRRAGLVPVPHISARRIARRSDLDHFLGNLVDRAEVDRIFVVAGDLPAPAGPFADSLAVIESGLIENHGIRTVGIAGYPQGHPHLSDAKLWDVLQAKHAALAALGVECYVATQFAFDGAPVAAWLNEIRRRDMLMGVRIGVPGPASVRTLLRFAARCGVGVSAKVMSRYGLSATKLLGTAGPEQFLDDLSARLAPALHGDTGLHFYPFGGLLATAKWISSHRQQVLASC